MKKHEITLINNKTRFFLFQILKHTKWRFLKNPINMCTFIHDCKLKCESFFNIDSFQNTIIDIRPLYENINSKIEFEDLPII